MANDDLVPLRVLCLLVADPADHHGGHAKQSFGDGRNVGRFPDSRRWLLPDMEGGSDDPLFCACDESCGGLCAPRLAVGLFPFDRSGGTRDRASDVVSSEPLMASNLNRKDDLMDGGMH